MSIRNIAGHRPRRRRRSPAVGEPDVVEDDRNDDDDPRAATTNRTPPRVNDSDMALSLTKPRFSSSPWTMFSVSNNDFIAAFALQSETPRPTREVRPERLRSLRGDPRELFARDVDGSAGQKSTKLIQVPRYGRRIREQSINRDQSRDGRKDSQNAVVGHARSERQDPMLRYVRIDAQQDVLPAARGDFRRRGRPTAATVVLERATVRPCGRGEDGGDVVRVFVTCEEVFRSDRDTQQSKTDATSQPLDDDRGSSGCMSLLTIGLSIP